MPVPGVLYLNLCPPHPPCSPLPPIRACCRKSFFPFSFFPFFPFIRTCQLQHRRHLHLTSPSHRRYPIAAAINPVAATSTLQLLHQPRGRYNCHHVTPCRHANYPLHPPSHVSRAHASHPAAITLAVPSAPKKAPDKSSPFFFSFIFNGAGHPPPLDTGLFHPPVACKHPPHLPSRACMPPIRPPHNHHHLNASMTGVTQLCHTDRGCKRCAGPHHFRDTPFTHPPRLCRSSHSCGCPCWPPLFTRPAPPAVLSCMSGGKEGQRAPSPLCPGYANRAPQFMRHASHARPPSLRACRGVQEGLWGMHARGRAMRKGRGRECRRASGRGT